MKRIPRLLLPFTLGAALTALIGRGFLGAGSQSDRQAPPSGTTAAAQVWTCSMHPQIRMDHKDLCPLCGMELTPVDARQDPWEAEAPGTRLVLGAAARRMARIETTAVLRRALSKELRTVGRVEFDETRVAYIAARINGRVDRVYADFPGTIVRQGDHLVRIYSPDLLSTQQEFLTALRSQRAVGRETREGLAAASRRRLLLWGITEEQIAALENSGQAQDHLVVYAPMGGTVIEKGVRPGQYVKEGDALYTIADLSRVWLVLEVYESELSWVRVGQPVEVTLESEPQRPLTGSVAFVEPVLTNASRSVRVRVIVPNQDARLKPGMYAEALLRVPIVPDGQPSPTGLEGKYICPMHPYEVSATPAECPQCNMPLERVGKGPTAASKTDAAAAAPPAAPAPPDQPATVLAVPADAVLTTGQRQLVYVEREPGRYELVEPKLGPRAGAYYPVLSGLAEGDRVVARGNFLLDSQYQITGRASLLYPGGSTGEYAAADPSTGFTPNEQANLDKLPPEDRALAAKQKTCPITGARLGSMGTPYKMDVDGRPLFLCCKGCEGKVKADPAAALAKLQPPAETPAAGDTAPADFSAEELESLDELPADDRALAKRQRICPITDMNLGSMGKPYKLVIEGRTLFLCCQGCEDQVKADPAAAFKKLAKPAGSAEQPPRASQGPGGSRD